MKNNKNRRAGAGKSSPSFFRYLFIFLLIAGFLLVLCYLLIAGRTPLLLPLVYLLLCITTWLAYWRDKRAAEKGQWRIRESTLHSLALFGGWPAALLAQQRLRHKNRKPAFQLVFFLTVLLNLAALAYLHSPTGQSFFHASLRQLDLALRSFGANPVTDTLSYLLRLHSIPAFFL